MRGLSSILKTVVKSRLILIFVMLLPTLALGEPTKTPKYLMAESMSLMDWGIYKANKRMKSFEEYKGIFPVDYSTGWADYDWDENRITLIGMFRGDAIDATTVENCTKSVFQLKNSLLSPFYTKADKREAAESMLSELFSHEGGYRAGNRPDDVGKQLVHITTIEARIFTNNADGSVKSSVKCKSNFKSEDVLIIAK